MTTTGTIYATGCITDPAPTGVDTVWVNAIQATGNDSLYATTNAGITAFYSTFLLASFDISSIPSNATINGVIVGINRDGEPNTGDSYDAGIYLTQDGVKVGTDQSVGTAWPKYGPLTWSSDYGGSGNLWGASISPTASLGVAARVYIGDDKYSTARIGAFRAEVIYTVGGSGVAASGGYNVFSGNRSGQYFSIIEAA